MAEGKVPIRSEESAGSNVPRGADVTSSLGGAIGAASELAPARNNPLNRSFQAASASSVGAVLVEPAAGCDPVISSGGNLNGGRTGVGA